MGTSFEPSFLKYLRLLGFSPQELSDSKSTKDLLSNDLFQLPNRDAFQKIVYFLFQCLDPLKCSSEFRDCWPIIEKKQEAEFRRNAYTWYKDLQTENPERLPQITASLFQSPGGRKFLNFISSLTRFVVLRHLKKQPERQPLWENVARPSWPLAKTLLPQLITDNNESSQREFKSLVSKQSKGQELIDRMCVSYREIKLKVKNLEEENALILDQANAELSKDKILSDDSLSPEIILTLLLQTCAEKKKKAEQLRNNFDQIASSSLTSIELVQSTVSPGQASESLLDLREYPLARGAQSLSDIFEKLLDKTVSIESDLSVMTVPHLPLNEIRVALDVVTRHKDNCVNQKRHLEHEVEPSLEHSITVLRSKLSGVDWRKVFGHQTSKCLSTENFDSPQFVVPPSPGIHLDASPKPDFAPKSFILQTVRDKQQAPIFPEVFHTTFKELVPAMKVETVETGYDHFSPPWKLSSRVNDDKTRIVHTSVNSVQSNGSSDHFQLPLSSHFYGGRNRVISTKSADCESSKLSVFSPIMSSSRMETMTSSKPVLSDFESGGKKESSALHRLPSVAISEASLIIEQPFEASLLIAEVPCKALNESMTEALSVTPVFHRTTKFQGFRLSPSVLGDLDTKSSPPVMSKPSNRRDSHASRRRDSGLHQIMSKLERVNIGDFTPIAADNRRIHTRLDDLISTLSFSPSSHTLLSGAHDDSFLQMPKFPDFE